MAPILLIEDSEDDEDEDVIRSYSLGASADVRKPVDFNPFTEAAKTLGRLILDQHPPTRA